MDEQNYEQFEKQYENLPSLEKTSININYDDNGNKTRGRRGAKSNLHHHSTLCKLMQRNKRLGRDSKL